MKKIFSIILSIVFVITLSSTVFSQTYQNNDPDYRPTFIYDKDIIENDLDLFRLYQSDTSDDYVLGPLGDIVGGNYDVSVLFDTDPDNDYEALEITLDPLSEGTYYYVVTAVDTFGNESGKSNQVTLIVDYTSPLAPNGLNTTNPTITNPNTNPVINWIFNNPPTDFKVYRIYKTTTSGVYQFGSENAILEINDINTNIVILDPVDEGLTYIVVTAVDKIGNESLPSNEIVISADYTSPVTPTGLKCLGLDVYIP